MAKTLTIQTRHVGVITWPEPGQTEDEAVNSIASRFSKLTLKQLGNELSKSSNCFRKIIQILGPILPDNVYTDILEAAVICASVGMVLEESEEKEAL